MPLRFAAALLLALAPITVAQTVAGRWDANIRINNLDIPFRFELSGIPPNIQGVFFNGEEKVTSTGGHYADGSLMLRWDHLATRLEAKYKDGVIEGQYSGKVGPGAGGSYAFRATRYAGPPAADPNAPSIGGLWIIPNKSPKGEAAWRFVVQQTGANVSAAILRVDGDTGAITGTYRNGKFFLSHFSGARPNLLEVTLQSDGTLDILQNGKTRLTAVRAEQAKVKGIPMPDDPTTHTGVKDASDPFRFSFPDLSGKTVANTDARFRNRVVLVEITGSWCPNCHDEAPFLVELYRKYHDRGLEIVALSFEEEEQLTDPARLRAFVKKYGIDYTVLLCGVPDEAAGKLTQAVHWNAWPTTFFLGRDGRVRSVHTGFPSSASGDLYRQAKADFTAQVERLLAENQHASR